LERQVFRDADAIVIVSRKLADYILRLYPWARNKVHVIPHGYAPVEPLPPVMFRSEARPMIMLHAGAFLPGYREPHALFEGLALLNRRIGLEGRLKAVFVGEDTGHYHELARSLGISGVVDLLPSIPYQQCQQMIADSDLLLVLDAPQTEGIFLPTKLIEYLAHQKPVLGLSESGSTVHEVLQECDLAFADQNSPEDIACMIEKLLTQWETGAWSVSEASKAAGLRYRIGDINKALDDLLLGLYRRDIG
jgi:glycosyltransferase involved in cell wall biosynthesis